MKIVLCLLVFSVLMYVTNATYHYGSYGMSAMGGMTMGGGMGKGGHGMMGGYSMAPIVISAPQQQSYQQPMPMPMYSKGGKRRRGSSGGFGGDNMLMYLMMMSMMDRPTKKS